MKKSFLIIEHCVTLCLFFKFCSFYSLRLVYIELAIPILLSYTNSHIPQFVSNSCNEDPLKITVIGPHERPLQDIVTRICSCFDKVNQWKKCNLCSNQSEWVELFCTQSSLNFGHWSRLMYSTLQKEHKEFKDLIFGLILWLLSCLSVAS